MELKSIETWDTEEYPFFSTAHGTFSRTGHIWGHKTSINRHGNESGKWPQSHLLKVKYLRTNLNKEVKDIHNGNLKMLKRENVKDTGRWQDPRAQGLLGSILWRWSSFKSNPYKNSNTVSHINWTSLKFTSKYARSWRVKNNSNQHTTRDSTIPNFKLYYRMPCHRNSMALAQNQTHGPEE